MTKIDGIPPRKELTDPKPPSAKPAGGGPDPVLLRRATVRMIAVANLVLVLPDVLLCIHCLRESYGWARAYQAQPSLPSLQTTSREFLALAGVIATLATVRATTSVGLWQLKTWGRLGAIAVNLGLAVASSLSVVYILLLMNEHRREMEFYPLLGFTTLAALATLAMIGPLATRRSSPLFLWGYSPRGTPPTLRHRWPAAALLIMGLPVYAYRDLFIMTPWGN